MSYLFGLCTSIVSLPDISKWDISNVKDMSYMFNECQSLSFLPDLSKLKSNNTIDINKMFNGCITLIKIPKLSNWKTINENITDYLTWFLWLQPLKDYIEATNGNSKENSFNIYDTD